MKHVKRASVTFVVAAICLLSVLPAAFAAGPQRLPAQACNAGTERAAQDAPNRTAAEAIPHSEHAEGSPLPDLDYCHHFNPTAPPPA